MAKHSRKRHTRKVRRHMNGGADENNNDMNVPDMNDVDNVPDMTGGRRRTSRGRGRGRGKDAGNRKGGRRSRGGFAQALQAAAAPFILFLAATSKKSSKNLAAVTKGSRKFHKKGGDDIA